MVILFIVNQGMPALTRIWRLALPLQTLVLWSRRWAQCRKTPVAVPLCCERPLLLATRRTRDSPVPHDHDLTRHKPKHALQRRLNLLPERSLFGSLHSTLDNDNDVVRAAFGVVDPKDHTGIGPHRTVFLDDSLHIRGIKIAPAHNNQ